MNLFVFGLGYSVMTLVRRHRDRFTRVAGTVRTAGKAAALRAEGIAAHVFDGTSGGDEALLADLAAADALILSAPPGQAGDPALAAYGEAIAAAPRLIWIGYLSTIGVYGDRAGGRVDETAEPRPTNERLRRRVEAERAWLALGARTGKTVAIFRIAGIYGPGRNALVDLAAGTAHRIVKPGQVFNRIHVDDIAAVLAAALERAAPGAVYNLADDEPAPPQDVVAHAARLLGVAPPPEVPFEEADLSPMARSFWGANKRVSNQRIREELGVTLAYPTYREGLAALLAAGEGRTALPAEA
ncbi:SDR family oxidoreductase [Chelatococcus sp. SYSU_G07232]|uniref:SDR family oxidoreductase n=1 Tax=Chelatococcus albus TaxID=3047466 RepID=A0ABT7ALB3_9HYPH|nr:SDR family oxidoreductase [Chelatococcus sp. SYSU_G07232]MDJ1160169.1 SDR family oxidoreductase [Chelatococcus sp. SYSU_G07232]